MLTFHFSWVFFSVCVFPLQNYLVLARELTADFTKESPVAFTQSSALFKPSLLSKRWCKGRKLLLISLCDPQRTHIVFLHKRSSFRVSLCSFSKENLCSSYLLSFSQHFERRRNKVTKIEKILLSFSRLLQHCSESRQFVLTYSSNGHFLLTFLAAPPLQSEINQCHANANSH